MARPAMRKGLKVSKQGQVDVRERLKWKGCIGCAEGGVEKKVDVGWREERVCVCASGIARLLR